MGTSVKSTNSAKPDAILERVLIAGPFMVAALGPGKQVVMNN
jgi:hypothetical protein